MSQRLSISNRLWIAQVFLLLAAPMGASGPSPTELSARLKDATALMALGSVDRSPWHLKLDITVYDNKGKNPQAGTVEMWKSGPDSRQTFAFGEAHFTRLLHGGERFIEGDVDAVPYRATEVLEQVLSPGPVKADLEGSTPSLETHQFGKVKLDCIMLSQQVKNVSNLPLGLYPTFCLDQGTEKFRSSYSFGTRSVVMNGIGKFLGHEIVTKLDVMSGTSVVTQANVAALTTYTPEPQDFIPSAEMKPENAELPVDGKVIAGNNLIKFAPEYPHQARMNHVSGTVTLRALIGRDGHVHALRPLSSPDPDLTLSAILAVRQWTYKPFLLNGVPTEIDTTIVVNYRLNTN